MSDKINSLQALAAAARTDVTAGLEHWLGYLESVGRLYRHGYTEQLLIHAQKPGASYCMDLEGWKKARRIVRTNSKSIAVPCDEGGNVRVRFLFDVSDTTPMRSTRPHTEWKTNAVALEELFGHRDEYELKDHILALTLARINEYAERHSEELQQSAGASDAQGTTNMREFAGVSTAYAVLSRMGVPASVFAMEDFYNLPAFDASPLADFYIAAASDAAGGILHEIEMDVQLGQRGRLAKMEIPRHNEASEEQRTPPPQPHKNNIETEGVNHGAELPASGQIQDTGYSSPATEPPAAGQIRPDAPELPDGEPGDGLQPDGDGRDADRPPAGGRPPDTGTGGAGRSENAGGTGAGRDDAGQKQQPAGLDGHDEQPEKPRRRTGTARNGVQQLSLFGEPEQAEENEGGKLPSSFSVGSSMVSSTLSDDMDEVPAQVEVLPEDIRFILTRGSSFSGGKMRIYGLYQSDATSSERIKFLKNEYGTGGRTITYPDGTHGSEWHDSKGIGIEKSKDSSYVKPDMLLKWPQVDKELRALVLSGQYLTPEEQQAYRHRSEAFALSKKVADYLNGILLYLPMVDSPNWNIRYEPGQRFYIDGEAREILEIDENGDVWHIDPEEPLDKERDLRDVFEYAVLADEYNGYYVNFVQEKDNAKFFRVAVGDVLHDHRDRALTVARFDEDTIHFTQEEIDGAYTHQRFNRISETLVRNSKNAAHIIPAAMVPEKPPLPELREEVLALAGDIYDDLYNGMDAYSLVNRLDNSERDEKVLAFATEILEGSAYRLRRSLSYEFTNTPSKYESINLFNRLNSQLLRQAGIEHTPIPALPKKAPAGKRKAEEPAPESPRAIVLPADDPESPEWVQQYGEDVNVRQEGDGYAIEPADTDEDTMPQTAQDEVSSRAFPSEIILNEIEIPQPEPARPKPSNYRIRDANLGKGGSKAKFQMNVDAIKTLQALEAENRHATPEEQETLAQYVGWGSLPYAFDEKNSGWQNEYHILKELLNEQEYAAARASTLTAFYTPPVVISSIYKTLENMGFAKGNILDPGMGTGNFFGLLPESMGKAKLYGVEIEPLTGGIAQRLYPYADIRVQGYEDTLFPDAFFDVAVGNVPFGAFAVADKRYDKQKLHIHDYFFIKTLDKVRPGGVIAFVTSKGTLDKKDETVRQAIAEQADLLGAIRLPSGAFKENAGTEVTSDIIFLQKKERPVLADPDWIRVGETETGVPVNQYFVENPHMLLGEMVFDESMYGKETDTACQAFEGAVLEQQLERAIQYIEGEYTEPQPREQGDDTPEPIEADPNVQNFSYTIVKSEADPKGMLYYRENSLMYPVETNKTAMERIRGLVHLRDCTRRLIQLQLDGAEDAEIDGAQKELNMRYDAFTKKYGLINSRANKQVFSDDGGYYLLCSLEILDENGGLERKADMFSKRTIRNINTVTEVDTPSEALAVSIAEQARVDLIYMHGLLGEKMEIDEITDALSGVIFHDPTHKKDDYSGWKPADEYLSGNVREKLRAAELMAENDPGYTVNVEALKAVQPKDLEASEIDVRLGATWIPPDDIKLFMNELFGTSVWSRDSMKIIFSSFNGQWNIRNKNADSSNVKVSSTYGTSRANAYKLLEDALNLRATKIWDKVIESDGKESRVLNKQETMLAQQKQEQIKEAFKDWIFGEPERRRRLVDYYNENFNAIRPREYDGSHITFVGMNPEITLGEHQKNAVARGLYGGNALFAHVVGAGKTFEMVATAMEAKRLGLCNKSLVVVPNHLTEQWASEWMQLYPSANILVATKKDFMTSNRKKFCGRIATGDYDAVIIGHSQFEKIPISAQRQIDMIERQIDQIIFEIAELKSQRAENFTIKQAEKTRKSLEARLKKLNDTSRKDAVVTFEELGTDKLLVDEAHFYKNLFVYSKMRNVAGISQSEAQKSTDLYMKCQYLDEITGGRGVIFATGTPISNSMTELYTMMRYLQTYQLARMNLEHFDSWASTFGETVSAMELAPEGTGFRMKTRFARFYNLPELMAAFKECADIQTADMLNLPVPKLKTGKPIDVVVEPTEQQKDMVAKLADRAQEVRDGGVDPRVDNMLKITNDGRKLALDQRLIDPDLPDDPASKLNVCIDNIYRIWEETNENRSTQMVFCDLSTPKRTIEFSENPDAGEDEMNLPFNVYWDIYEKLGEMGVPGKEIAFIHDAKSEVQKAELFAKVRSGQVRVLIGSTFKMGAGTNVQRLLKALHHLDVPWRPSDIEQREGRMVRQGNLNDEVEIYRYVTKGTFDAYSWGLIENKQKFISQIMTSKSPVRSCEDVDESVLSFAEIKALATGNPYIKEKFDIEMEVAKLKLLRGNHQNNRYRLEDALVQRYPQELQAAKERVDGLSKDLELLQSSTKLDNEGKLDFAMVVNDVRYTDKEKAGKAILIHCAKAVEGPVEVGSYRGFRMQMEYEPLGKTFKLHLIGALRHTVSLGADDVGNITRINNGLDGMPERLQKSEEKLSDIGVQMENAKAEIAKPFPREDELTQKQDRLIELVALLKIDEKQIDIVDDAVIESGEENERQCARVGAGIER